MAVLAIFKCNACGNEFETHFGGLMRATELRCEKCDNRKLVEVGTKQGVCEKCGGEMKNNLLPMCPKCKARDTKEKKALIYID
jgi:DNA-directed RNA polymerase subunit RPC12/RpoP